MRSIRSKLRSQVRVRYEQELELIDEKMEWLDAFNHWQPFKNYQCCSPIQKKEVNHNYYTYPLNFLIYLKDDYPFIKGVHLVIDEFVHDFDFKAERFRIEQYHGSIDFCYEFVFRIEIYSGDKCKPIYEVETSQVKTLKGYECGI